MGADTALLALLLALSAGLPYSSAGGAPEGGPSTFGYDASSACSKPYSRIGRARPENLPCDFRRENWCAIAGNTYPWHAVRRFVQENQGLMRRMYGDEKHISVLKNELEKNDVELELEDDHNQLYSDDSSSLFRQIQLDVDYAFDPIADRREGTRQSREHLSRSMNVGTSSKHDKPKSNEPESRLSENASTARTSTTQSSTTSSTGTTTASTTSQPSTVSGISSTLRTSPSHRTKMTPVTTPTPSLSTRDAIKDDSTTSFASTTPIVSLVQIAKIQNLSINEIPGQIDRFDANVDELTEIPELLVEEALADTTSVDGIATASQYVSTSSERTEDGKIGFEDYELKFEEVQDAEVSESQQRTQQFRPRPEYRPPEVARPEAPSQGANGGSMEGQLYQDVAAKDKQEPVLKVRGINACPVKEEVVAPFWANNTRGEVLALLNLYPFEQYVHWEKCTHENKQMYCRDGCRCEQQYRLHRLLAYDPNNECRGIFSDWFKFPSCCICRCYDLPIEFRVTSRSPRLVHQRQRLKVRAPRAPPRQRHP